jgi:hypothetical protein
VHRCAGFLLHHAAASLAEKIVKTRSRHRTGQNVADDDNIAISSRRFRLFEARPLLHSPHFLLYD